MRLHTNTLFIQTQGAYLTRDHQTFRVKIEKKVALTIPIHHLQGIICFGRVSVSPGVYPALAEAGLALSFLSEQGRFLARVEPPTSGNVLLRRQQFRLADDPVAALKLARPIVAGKIQNSRQSLLRSARDAPGAAQIEPLQKAAGHLAALLAQLPQAQTLDEVRGHEGAAARVYFDSFPHMVRVPDPEFKLNGRTRRPPKDPVNAMLSFTYAFVRHDCVAALQSVGLDPAVGFLHADRPGRLSLALDLMEEFRPLLADRLVLTLINRRQVSASGFRTEPGGAVILEEKTRREVIKAYQERKREEVKHPLLQEAVPLGLMPFLQARLLARTLRGELAEYPTLALK